MYFQGFCASFCALVTTVGLSATSPAVELAEEALRAVTGGTVARRERVALAVFAAWSPLPHPYEKGFDLRLVPEKLAEPLRWSRPRRIFVNSMSDLFHKDVSDSYVKVVAEVMRTADWHTYPGPDEAFGADG